MKTVLRQLLLMTALLFAMAFHPAMAADAPVNYTGHYELAGSQADRVFSIDVKQTGSHAEVSFSASMTDGSGAAPDADGTGEVKAGVLHFTFKDTFENEGTGILTKTKGAFHLTLTVPDPVEPRPLRFYGDILLKKTSSKPE